MIHVKHLKDLVMPSNTDFSMNSSVPKSYSGSFIRSEQEQNETIATERLRVLASETIAKLPALDEETRAILIEWSQKQNILNLFDWLPNISVKGTEKHFYEIWNKYLLGREPRFLQTNDNLMIIADEERYFAEVNEYRLAKDDLCPHSAEIHTTRIGELSTFKTACQYDTKALVNILDFNDGQESDWLRILVVAFIKFELARIKKIRKSKEALTPEVHTSSIVKQLEIRKIASVDDNYFSRMPRIGAPIAHLLGGGPHEIANVDGELFAAEPQAAKEAAAQVLRPKSWDIVPEDWTRNGSQQLVIPGILENPDLNEYLVASATNAATATHGLPQLAAKLVPLIFATAPHEPGAFVEGTLQQLTEMLNPGRRVRERDRERAGATLAALKRFRIIPTIDNRKTPIELFSIKYSLSKDPDSYVSWMIDPYITAAMLGEGKTKDAIGIKRGYFPINYTRLMQLDIKNPGLFPLYLILCGHWNDARVNWLFDENRIKEIRLDELAFWMNKLPKTAADYTLGKNKSTRGKLDLKDLRDSLISDLEQLKEAGLLAEECLSRPYGKPWTIKPMPPKDLIEAYRIGASKTGNLK